MGKASAQENRSKTFAKGKEKDNQAEIDPEPREDGVVVSCRCLSVPLLPSLCC